MIAKFTSLQAKTRILLPGDSKKMFIAAEFVDGRFETDDAYIAAQLASAAARNKDWGIDLETVYS